MRRPLLCCSLPGCLQNKIRLMQKSGWSRKTVTGFLIVDRKAGGEAGTPGAM